MLLYKLMFYLKTSPSPTSPAISPEKLLAFNTPTHNRRHPSGKHQAKLLIARLCIEWKWSFVQLTGNGEKRLAGEGKTDPRSIGLAVISLADL